LEYSEYLRTRHWQDVRKRALVWAKWKCQACGKKKPLEVHHNTYAYWNEQREDVIALCRECHVKLFGDKKAPPVPDIVDSFPHNKYPFWLRTLFKTGLPYFVELFGEEASKVAANILEIKNL
jgi:hypothetical protein